MAPSPVDMFGGTISTLSQSLDLRARKHEMILNNVANADTPNFRPFKMNVEEALQKQLSPHQTQALKRTDDQHLSGNEMADEADLELEASGSDPLLFRGDQNGVDVDAEMTALAKNTMLYKVSSQIVGSKFSSLKKAIIGGAK